MATIRLEIAQKTADYVLREMTSPEGGFFSAQDADSEGEEGRYYVFTPGEIADVLGKENAEAFCRRYDISASGNFEGKNIPNLLKSDPHDRQLEELLPQLYQYRKSRFRLHLDDKILTAWNGLMIAALCALYLACGKTRYLEAAKKADEFIQNHLCQNDTLFVSFRDGKRGVPGFLDDYAGYLYAQLALYKATLNRDYIARADRLCDRVQEKFGDPFGGYYLYGHDSEALISRPKESYDGAIPSGNSLMAYGLVRLALITEEEKYRSAAARQLEFLAAEAAHYPPGYAMFLTALSEHLEPPMKITVAPDAQTDPMHLPLELPADAAVVLLPKPTEEYPLKNGKTTYYVCQGHRCLPPTNELPQ